MEDLFRLDPQSPLTDLLLTISFFTIIYDPEYY